MIQKNAVVPTLGQSGPYAHSSLYSVEVVKLFLKVLGAMGLELR